jgi:hypothetical protein
MRALRLSSLQRRGRRFTKRCSYWSYKQTSRWLARFTRECERESRVTTFYPCRHAMPNTRCCMRPSGQDEPVRTRRPIYQDGARRA